MRRPITRGQCRHVKRPCPFVACRYHLPEGAPESCSLDVADHGEVVDMVELAELLQVSPSRARALLSETIAKLRRAAELDNEEDHHGR